MGWWVGGEYTRSTEPGAQLKLQGFIWQVHPQTCARFLLGTQEGPGPQQRKRLDSQTLGIGEGLRAAVSAGVDSGLVFSPVPAQRPEEAAIWSSTQP